MQLNKVKNSYNAISRNEILDQYGTVFTRKTYEYVCGDYSDGQMSLFCSDALFSISGSGVCHFPEISTSVISNAALYDYTTQDRLYHHIDAVFENGEPIYRIKVVDQLSDNSYMYNIIYGNDPEMDGWDDRGIWLFSGGRSVYSPNSDFDILSGVNPRSLSELDEGEMGQIKITYDSNKGVFMACVTSSYLVGIQLSAEISVSASGYVMTTPNGTMFSGVDNYCSSDVSKKVSNVVLGLTPVQIDGAAVKAAMNAIYSQTFYDSYNLIGSSSSYNHSAHPTSLDVKLRFSLSDSDEFTMIPIVATFPTSVTFYHAQENVSYSVPVNTTNTVNSLAIVENLSI